jgi:hypothetical protein
MEKTVLLGRRVYREQRAFRVLSDHQAWMVWMVKTDSLDHKAFLVRRVFRVLLVLMV